MDAAAITSAAQAVHQELVRRLAEQARINRLVDQLRRARPDAGSWLSPTAPGSFSFGPAATGGPAVSGLDATAGVPGLTGLTGLTGPGGVAALCPPAAPA